MRKALFILGKLTDSDLQWLLDAGEAVRVRQGSVIIEQDKPLDRLFIVVDGEFSITRGGSELACLGTGEVVGEMSMVDTRPPRANVTARCDSLLHAVPLQFLRSKLRADTGFASRFYHAICIFLVNRLDRTDSMIGLGSRIAASDPTQGIGEIPSDTMESMFLAGTRFDWFLDRVRER